MSGHGREILYIVGNGFDLQHKIPSSYQNFRDYLKASDHETYRLVEEYLGIDDEDWWNLEAALAHFDAAHLIDQASSFLTPYGAPDWRDSANHDYQFEIQQVVGALSGKLRFHFANWICTLPIPDAESIEKPLRVAPTALFLSFNYTPTLEKGYRVPADRILHVHGVAGDAPEKIILGHGWKRSPTDSFNHGVDPEIEDIRFIEGNRIVDQYFDKTFKPTIQIIEENAEFFSALGDVGEIRVLGHSLANVDAPYFKAVIEHIRVDSVDWRVSYHGDPSEARDRFGRFGIDPRRVNFYPITDT